VYADAGRWCIEPKWAVVASPSVVPHPNSGMPAFRLRHGDCPVGVVELTGVIGVEDVP